MRRKKKQKPVEDVQVKEESKEVKKPAKKEFNLDVASKMAEKYLPKDEDRYEIIVVDGKEKKMDKYDVMFVCEDGNVFYKQNEGSARHYERKTGKKLIEVKF